MTPTDNMDLIFGLDSSSLGLFGELHYDDHVTIRFPPSNPRTITELAGAVKRLDGARRFIVQRTKSGDPTLVNLNVL